VRVVPLLVERVQGETQLFVKELKHAGERHIVCRNEAERLNDRAAREAIVAALDAQLASSAAAALFRHARIRMPPGARPARPPPVEPQPKPHPKRRGRSKRGATPTRITPETRKISNFAK
jgi:hypothetical protein